MDNSLIKIFEQNKKSSDDLDNQLVVLLSDMYSDLKIDEKYPKLRDYISNSLVDYVSSKTKNTDFYKNKKIDVDYICDLVKTIKKWLEKIGDSVLEKLGIIKDSDDYKNFIKNTMNNSIKFTFKELGIELKEDESFIKERSNNIYVIERNKLKTIVNETKICINEQEKQNEIIIEKENMENFSKFALISDENLPTLKDVIEVTKILKQENSFKVEE